MTNTTDTTRPGYRKPWTFGAYAYPQADTMADLRESMKRKRSTYIIHVTIGTDATVDATPCAYCHRPVSEPEESFKSTPQHAIVTVYPKERTAVFEHYGCSWLTLFKKISAIHV